MIFSNVYFSLSSIFTSLHMGWWLPFSFHTWSALPDSIVFPIITFFLSFSSLTFSSWLVSLLYSLPQLQINGIHTVLGHVLLCVGRDLAKISLLGRIASECCMDCRSSEYFPINPWHKGERQTMVVFQFSTWPIYFCLQKLMLCLQGSCHFEEYVWCWPFPVGMCQHDFCSVLSTSNNPFLYTLWMVRIEVFLVNAGLWYTAVLNPMSY